MTPQQAYDWLAPKLSLEERRVLEVIYASVPDSALNGWKYGCHCDLEPGMTPDFCWIDEGKPDNCCLAMRLVADGKGRDDCPEWKPIVIAHN